MNKTSLFLMALCSILLSSNAYLLFVNHALARSDEVNRTLQLPAEGSPLIPIAVHGVSGAQAAAPHPLVFNSGNHAHLLLVMSPNCPYCERNWPEWDRLVKELNPAIDVTYFDVSGKFDKRVSAQHGIRDEQIVTASLESAIEARIVGTPTTVLIAIDGTVKHVWQGVLDQQQVGDIIEMSNQG